MFYLMQRYPYSKQVEICVVTMLNKTKESLQKQTSMSLPVKKTLKSTCFVIVRCHSMSSCFELPISAEASSASYDLEGNL